LICEYKREVSRLETDQIANNDDNWTLSTAQIIFMLQHHNEIELADENDDEAFFDCFINSDEFRSLFGDMTFDEAYDRYETMLEAGCSDL
jgi:hypothetical protein